MNLHYFALMICCIKGCGGFGLKNVKNLDDSTPKIVHAEKREFVRQWIDLENTWRLAMFCLHAF